MNIKTERCIITELIPSDFKEAMNLFTDNTVRQYLGGAITQDAACKKLESWISDNTGLYFCIRASKTNDFVGIISITKHHDDIFKELAYQFLPQFWGMGMATESISAILELLRKNISIKELIAETQSRNLSSCRLLEKLGFEFENTVIRFGEEQSIYKYIL